MSAVRTRRLLLRWSWRDLRRRWGLVLLTAMIIAVGTGTYAGLGGSTPWRLRSSDASYALLRYHDLRVRLPENTDAEQGVLESAVRSIPSAELLAAVEERLVVPMQVDASTGGRTVLVPGEIVGMAEPTAVDTLHVVSGTQPAAGSTEVLLDSKFAEAQGLAGNGELTVSGGRRVRYSGTGYSPEYFRVVGGSHQLTGELGFAVMFAPLRTAQELSGHPGRVNDVVVRLAAGADADAVAAEVEAALAERGATVETRADDQVRRTLYADARNDEKMWTFLSLLVLVGASFAAFNLVSRMVDAERHEIGVAMALGTPVRRIALRPLLVGAQIAALGVLLGVGVGVLAGAAMRQVLTTELPLPVWETPFPASKYAWAAVLGIALPLAATAIPVWRAVRVEPVDALRPMSGSARGRAAGLAPLLRRARFGRRIVPTMPFRNVLRSPRRTLLTALGIAAAITTLVTVLGMLDSIFDTLDRSDAEVTRTAPRRMEVGLTGFVPADSPTIAAIAASPVVASAEPGLRLSATLSNEGREVDTIVDLVDFDRSMWTPSLVDGTAPVDRAGLVISTKAAEDLGVRVGDRIMVRHPVREGVSYRLVDTRMEVAGIHPNPLRFFTYLDTSQVDLFDLRGIVDTVLVDPDPGRSVDEVKRALFEQPGVSSVQEVGVLSDTIEERLGAITGVLRVLEVFSLALAAMIALNSATLAIEERRREQATMFAFGLPVRTVLRTIVVESALIAMLGTAVGIAMGIGATTWLLRMFTTDTLPEVGIETVLTPGSLVTVVALGVGVVAAAPLLAIPRLRRTDIPATLRVLE